MQQDLLCGAGPVGRWSQVVALAVVIALGLATAVCAQPPRFGLQYTFHANGFDPPGHFVERPCRSIEELVATARDVGAMGGLEQARVVVHDMGAGVAMPGFARVAQVFEALGPRMRPFQLGPAVPVSTTALIRLAVLNSLFQDLRDDCATTEEPTDEDGSDTGDDEAGTKAAAVKADGKSHGALPSAGFAGDVIASSAGLPHGVMLPALGLALGVGCAWPWGSSLPCVSLPPLDVPSPSGMAPSAPSSSGPAQPFQHPAQAAAAAAAQPADSAASAASRKRKDPR
jgi:hypothetical protein